MTDSKHATPGSSHPLQQAAPFDWIDSHTLLNALSVLRHRVRSNHAGKLEALDAISAYYANGAYLQAHGSCARLDYWVEWFTCCVEVAGLARSRELPCEVDAKLADLDGVYELSGLGKASVKIIHHLVSLPEGACRALTAGLSTERSAVITVEAPGLDGMAQRDGWPDGVEMHVAGPDVVSFRVALVPAPLL